MSFIAKTAFMKNVLMLIAVHCVFFPATAQQPQKPWVEFPKVPCVKNIYTNGSWVFQDLTPNDRSLFEKVWKLARTSAVFSWDISFVCDSFGDLRTFYVVPPKSDTDGIRFYRFVKNDRESTLTLTVYFNTEYGRDAKPYPDGTYKIYGNRHVVDRGYSMHCMHYWFRARREGKR